MKNLKETWQIITETNGMEEENTILLDFCRGFQKVQSGKANEIWLKTSF